MSPSNGSSAPLQNCLKSCCISRWHDMVFICTGSDDKSPWLRHCIPCLLQQGATLLCLLHQTESNHHGALQLPGAALCPSSSECSFQRGLYPGNPWSQGEKGTQQAWVRVKKIRDFCWSLVNSDVEESKANLPFRNSLSCAALLSFPR